MANRLSAARKLSGSAFKLFSFLDGFELNEPTPYERLETSKALGLGRETLNNAFNELLNTKYLREVNKSLYNFFTTVE